MNKKSKRVSHDVVEKKLLKDPAVKAEFDELMKDFEIVSELIHARILAKKTQAQVAQKMKTTTSVISRLESTGGGGRHSPTLNTIKKYAAAIGCEVQFKLRPIKKRIKRIKPAAAIRAKKTEGEKRAEK
jgi:transcriptional regulator with XRE-family HTH domain